MERIIETKEQFLELFEYIKPFKYVAYDTETTGLKRDCSVIGFSVCAEKSRSNYVVTAYWDKEKQDLIYTEASELAKDFLQVLATKDLIMHNSIFDCRVTYRNYGIELMPSLHTDTMELAHLLGEEGPLGLKDLGVLHFGAHSKKEQIELKESIVKNGGSALKKDMEIFKADKEIIAKYGAKDALLTFKLFYKFIPKLYEEKLEKFFYEDECMPLLKGPTYEMNNTGFKVDINRMNEIEKELTATIGELKTSVLFNINEYIKELYPATNKKTTFNLNSNEHLSWLFYIRLGYEFKKLTPGGKAKAIELLGKTPYSISDKRKFLTACREQGLRPEKFIQADKVAITKLKNNHKWIADLLEYKRLEKLLKTYVKGVKTKIEYRCIYPSFLQCGTTSGRYSSKNPNFQNLPRDDKRIKTFFTARPGKVFVSMDYAQLEPRIFSDFSEERLLINGFENNEDFYSVIGIKVFNKPECTAFKKDPTFFGAKYPNLRQRAKSIALAVAYGTTAYKLTDLLIDDNGVPLDIDQCNKIINDYFAAYPGVKKFIHQSHKEAKDNGVVYNLFGRPRRVPQALKLYLYGNKPAHELPYALRTPLNLSVNSKIQGTAASLMNRTMIAFYNRSREIGMDAKIVLQVHDAIAVECWEKDAERAAILMKDCAENTNKLKHVPLLAEMTTGKTLAELK